MATRTISTRIQLDGEQEFKKQMSSVNGELRNLKSEMALADATFKGQANTMEALTEKDRILRGEIEQQREKIRALEQAVVDASEAFGDTSSKTDGYRQSLNRAKAELIHMNDELEDTDKYLEEARDSSDGCAKSIDGFGKQVKDAKDSLDDLVDGLDEVKDGVDDCTESFGGFGDGSKGIEGILENYGNKLKVLGVAGAAGIAVNGLKEVAGAILEIEESTREYRQVMGTLEVSAQSAGYSAEQTAETYGRLHSVLGDTQTAATAAANLQALQIEQDKLMELTDSAIGAWAKYGDSIPIDGLSEAINETIRVGQVTGTFADVLNWGAQEGETYGVKLKEANEANEEWNNAVLDCKSAEDYFNLALQGCETQAERVDLVLRAMSEQGLSDAADAWVGLNDDIVKANESQARMDEAMGKLGESLAPLADGIRNFGANAISWLADRIEDATEAWNDFWSAMSKGDLSSERGQRMAASRGYDGSHAGGLPYVPYDGYIAELHEGEQVLTKMEAQARRGLMAGTPNSGGSVTKSDLQQVTAAAVNAINMGGNDQGRYVIEVKMNVNGKEFYRETIDDFRAVAKSNPEVK